MERNTGLVLAADFPSERIQEFIPLSDNIDAVKLGYLPILQRGIKVIDDFRKNFKVICDLKIADIPHISRKICESLFSNGAFGVIIHGFVGRDTIKECVKTSLEYCGEIYVISEMSHKGSLEFITKQSEKIAKIAKECGAHGIIAPGTRPERIKILKKVSGLQVLAPGIGAQGGEIADAVKNGADFIIVGRYIYDSTDLKVSVREVLEKIKEGEIAKNNSM